MNTWSREGKLLIGVLLAFLVGLCATFWSFEMSLQQPGAERSAEHSLQMLGALESLIQVTRDLDRSSFNYSLLKDSDSLRRYEAAFVAIQPLIDFMKAMASDEKKQQVQISRLETQLRVFQSQCSRLIGEASRHAVTNSERNQRSLAGGPEWQPSPLLNLIHSQILAIKTDEKTHLQNDFANSEERAPQSTAQSYASLVLLIALFFCFLLLMLLLMLHRQLQITAQATEAERRFSRQILEHAPIGIIILDNSFTVLDVNETFCGYLGLPISEITSKVLWDIIPALPRDKVKQCILSGQAYLEESAIIEIQRTDEAQDVHWDIAFWPVVDKNNVKGIVATVNDVSERMNLANHKQLLMQTVTHDLKSPLLAGSLILKALATDTDSLNSRQQHLVSRVRSSTDEALRMVKNILEVARYNDASDVLASENVDLNDTVKEAAEELKLAASNRTVVLGLSYAEAPCLVLADKAALHHMMLNLLDNAIKFSPPDGHVTVATRLLSDRCVIEVTDEGPGIPPDDVTNIFQAFWQSDAGKKVAGGTGVGLYLSKQIIRAFGGSISCDSKPGKTTFLVSLPMNPDRTQQIATEKEGALAQFEKHLLD